MVAMLLVFITGHSIRTAAATRSDPLAASGPSTTPYAATGYFYVTQKGSGFTLVTPQGEPFYASGIDTVATDGSGTDQVTGVCPYCQTITNDYPNTAAWGTSTISQLRSWGFNTLGAFSDYTDLGSQMPYEVQLTMASGNDWFAPSFVTHADARYHDAGGTACRRSECHRLLYRQRARLGSFPRRQWRHSRYGPSGVSAVAGRFTRPRHRAAVRRQPQRFPVRIGYPLLLFRTSHHAVWPDANHLILGVKAEGQEVEPTLIKAAAPYVNVFSIEDYQYKTGVDQGIDGYWPPYLQTQQNLADLEAVADIPLMIGEYSFMSDSSDPNTIPGIYATADTQLQRAQQYEQFIAPLYEDTPALVGDDWFQYVDEPANSHVSDRGEDDDFGMVNFETAPPIRQWLPPCS